MCAVRCMNYMLKSHIYNSEHLRLRHLAQQCTEPKIKAATKKRKTRPKEIELYMTSSEHLAKIKDFIPARFFKTNRKAPDDLYLVDCNVANTVASALEPFILSGNKTIIETNPGFGFITKELLAAGLEKVQLYDSTVCFQDHILDLLKEYPDQVKMFNRDFFSIWKLSYQDRHDNGNRVKKMLTGIEMREWSEEPTLAIIGTLATSDFIRHLILSLIFQFGVMTYGRCELYLMLPPPLYLQLTADPAIGYLLYRASSVMFQIFCDHEILAKLPRKAFLPWDKTREKKTYNKLQNVYDIDPDTMYLTRIVFKKDMPVPVDRLQHIWYFVRHMMLSRTNRVIPCIEQWVPGCGARLILANSIQNLDKNNGIYPDINIYTQIGQLSAAQILNLYREFSSWPEYTESSFIASMETALLKMESMQDMDSHNNEEESHEVEGGEHDKKPESHVNER